MHVDWCTFPRHCLIARLPACPVQQLIDRTCARPDTARQRLSLHVAPNERSQSPPPSSPQHRLWYWWSTGHSTAKLVGEGPCLAQLSHPSIHPSNHATVQFSYNQTSVRVFLFCFSTTFYTRSSNEQTCGYCDRSLLLLGDCALQSQLYLRAGTDGPNGRACYTITLQKQQQTVLHATTL